ncbi:hypothetical protein ABZ725_42195 [Streptomyces sp. NPDC006872]|uniref:hypothetical protein n=1 Tax=Streptomyces sp. NPDC006872 TaxID=3155720 RepID=UPI0033CDF757
MEFTSSTVGAAGSPTLLENCPVRPRDRSHGPKQPSGRRPDSSDGRATLVTHALPDERQRVTV